ncbi:MAG: vanadium-dependent haloperoxidase [Thermomicrobiales bacterium]
MSRTHTLRPVISRRGLLQSSLAGAALLPFATLPEANAASAWSEARGALTAPRRMQDASHPALWRTWLLTTPDQLRPEAPAEPTPDEIAELLELQAARDEAALALVHKWFGRPSVVTWTELASDAFAEFKMPPMRQSRAQGILQTAMYDAVIAAYDAQDAYNAPAPAAASPELTVVEGITDARPAYPAADAAVAGAAAAVLTSLLPDAAPGRFDTIAEEAAKARLIAGTNVRRDTDAGLALGQAVAQLALAHGADDRPGKDWDGSGRLEGPGYWQPTPPAFAETPLEPLGGTWRTWVLEAPDAFRPAPPPAYDTPAWQSQLIAVQEAVARRTFAQEHAARYWQGTAAAKLWTGFAHELIARDGLDLPHAARVLAYLGVTLADGQTAVWDAKYTYWTERPITADPELNVLFPTPNFPSYPSSHSTNSNSAAVILGHFFPDAAGDLFAMAEEASKSRCWAGIHFPVDDDAGTLLGRNVGYLIAAMASEEDDM